MNGHQMGTLDFQGKAPYAIPVVQGVAVQSIGTTVEMVLYVVPGDENPYPEPVAIPLTWPMAQTLAEHLQRAANRAEIADTKKK
jgi:hypothetical protein